MSIEQIAALLIVERDRLNRAIEALGAHTKRRGRPPKNAAATGLLGNSTALKRMGRPPMSASEKKAASARMKAYWAAKRASQKKS